MSGIAAIIHTDGRPVARGAIEAMAAQMDYRGPDGIAFWNSGPVALGHCMMHSTQESLEETQPLANEDESAILVMDGTLSNWHELRTELLSCGARLRTRSDAELVLRAYEQWGADCPEHIDGEYSFVIWDARRREAFCAKDHQGLRPLQYHWDGKTLLIASDIGAIVTALAKQPSINRGYMAEIMANEWYSPEETVWTGIKRLLPAHWMRLSSGSLQFHEFWNLPLEVSITYKTDQEYFDHYREMLADCIRRSARSHLPVGFEVSGGLDSSSLFCMAHKMLQDGDMSAAGIKAYTLAGTAGSNADEIEYARMVGRKTGRPVAEVPLFIPELDWFVKQAQADLDMPTYSNGAMSIGLHQQLVADGCRVSINGEGGDNWLDGTNFYYNEQLLDGDWRGLHASFRDDLANLGIKKTAWAAFRWGLVPIAPSSARSVYRKIKAGFVKLPQEGLYWIAPDMQAELSRRKQQWRESQESSKRWAYKLSSVKSPFTRLAYDLMSRQDAQVGIEARSPMLARQFIEFCAATPERTRLRGGVRKIIHRGAMAGILPDEIVERNTKADFAVTQDDQNEALEKFLFETAAGVLEDECDTGNLRRFFDQYCEAGIDDDLSWEVWGTFTYAVLRRNLLSKDKEEAL